VCVCEREKERKRKRERERKRERKIEISCVKNNHYRDYTLSAFIIARPLIENYISCVSACAKLRAVFKQYHRRTYASICICIHIHKYINIHICAQPAASVFADVYVGVKKHLCSIHTCSCTSVQNTCSKVHATLTAKKCTYIYAHTHIHMHTYVHEHTCTCITPSTR